MLVKQWPLIWGGNLLVHFICALLLWPYFSHVAISLWLASNLLLFAYRLQMKRRFQQCLHAGHQALRQWAGSYVLSAVIGGLIWGSASWLFFDSSASETTLLLLLVLTAISVGSLPALSSYSPAFIAFISAILLPTILRLLTLDGLFSNGIALMAFILLTINIFFSRRLDRTITESITADLYNRELLEEVSAARNMAEQANQTKSEFLAAVSHDLRQPLHAMGLFLASLENQTKEQRQRQTLHHIQMAHDSLAGMFDALLEISRLDSGSIKPVLSHFRLQSLLDELGNNFSPLAKKKGLQLTLADSPLIVLSDRVLLFGVLGNLLSNALKYTDKGSVQVSSRQQGKHIQLTIKDSGCGIAPADQERIFSAYQQLGNPERDASQGLGLGLAMVKKTCQLLAIKIHITSSVGKGSAFSLTLPLGQSDQIQHREAPSSDKALEGLHLLIIDDNKDILQGMSELLNTWGCLVSRGDSCQQALQAIAQKTRPVDLLICDYRLRNQQTGSEAIDIIRKQLDPMLPAMLITGDTNPALHSQLKKEGYYVLRKPIRAAQLKKAVAALTSMP